MPQDGRLTASAVKPRPKQRGFTARWIKRFKTEDAPLNRPRPEILKNICGVYLTGSLAGIRYVVLTLGIIFAVGNMKGMEDQA